MSTVSISPATSCPCIQQPAVCGGVCIGLACSWLAMRRHRDEHCLYQPCHLLALHSAACYLNRDLLGCILLQFACNLLGICLPLRGQRDEHHLYWPCHLLPLPSATCCLYQGSQLGVAKVCLQLLGIWLTPFTWRYTRLYLA